MRNIEGNPGRERLNRPEKPRNHTEKLKQLLGNFAEKINRETEEQYGLAGLLNPDCTIAVEGYAENRGGIYREEEMKIHKDLVTQRDFDFSAANSPRVQEFYGVQTPEEVVKRWKENKLKEKNGQTEMAVTALLAKILKDDFLVTRTASYDDYEHGVDNIILNKRTGEAICAFDEVHEGGAGDRTKKKEDKVKRFARKGGTEITYGLQLENGKLKRSSMKNIPVFFLGLKSEELIDLLNDMNYDVNSEPSLVERRIFAGLVSSLRKQQRELLSSSDIREEKKQHLKTFENSLAALEQISEAGNQDQNNKF